MKLSILPVMIVAMTLSVALVWADDMKGANSKDGTMKDMSTDNKAVGKTHHAVETVKSMDVEKGGVTISHGPIKSLNLPAMTMTFGVKDKGLLNQLGVGKRVEFDFVVEGSNYIIVKVKRS
jgi:Cu(I)/Ag(I) efflux system periplasmic protein CusF